MSILKTDIRQKKAVTSRLLAIAIGQEILNTRMGLRVDALPFFEPKIFYDELIKIFPNNNVRLGLLGFEVISEESDWLTHSAETAVRWRNEPNRNEKLIIILNPTQELQKVHSLHMLEPFNDEKFYQSICQQGIENVTDEVVVKVWTTLKKAKIKRALSLVSEQIISLFTELEAGTSISSALATLHLLPDEDIEIHQNLLDKRFKSNQRLVEWLDELDKAGIRILARALTKDSTNEISQTFGLIKQYRLKKSAENLASLSFQSVQKIREVPKPSSKSTVNAFKRKSASHTLVSDLLALPNVSDEGETDRFLDSFEAQAERASALFQDDVDEDYETDKERIEDETASSTTELGTTEVITRENSAEESVYIYPKDKDDFHPLHDAVRLWVHHTVWGGVLTIDNIIDDSIDLPNALQNDQLQQSFLPHPIDDFSNLITEIDKLAQQSINPVPLLTPLFKKLKEQRDKLVASRLLFLYYPLDANFTLNLKTAIPDYLEAYELFSKALQNVSRRIRKTNPESAELLNARFLAFDAVIVELNYSSHTVYNALLTPLHPLHLWKWYKLKEAMLSNTIPLREKEKVAVSHAIKALPTLLNTFMLHERMFPDITPVSEQYLVLAGEISNERRDDVIGIPYYTPTVHSLESVDGIKSFTKHLKTFLAVYPPSRLGLSLIIVDPPRIAPILEGLANLNRENEEGDRLLFGASVMVYQRSQKQPSFEVWGDNYAPTLQIFREHLHWQLQTHIKIKDYKDVLHSQIKQPHIILICDPSDAIVVSIDRRTEQLATPFGVPEQVTYDSITDTAKREPFPNGDLFESYAGIRRILSGESASTIHAIGRKVNKDDLQKLLNNDDTSWLAILDQAYGTAQIENLGQSLLTRRVGERKLTIYTNEIQWQTYWQTKLQDELQRFDLPIELDSTQLLQRISELFPILENGLLDLVREPNNDSHYHQPFDAAVLGDLLGVIATLNWYRREYGNAVMIRLDKAFEDWRDWKRESPDYLVCWLESEHLHIDVVTLFVQGKDKLLPSLPDAKKRLEQKVGLAETLISLYEQQDGLITPLRQSLLHRRLYDIVFSTTSQSPLLQTKKAKQSWANTLNKLFSSEMRPTIQLLHIMVGLHETSLRQPSVQVFDQGSSRFGWKSIHLPVEYITSPLTGDHQDVNLVLIEEPSQIGTDEKKLIPENISSKVLNSDSKEADPINFVPDKENLSNQLDKKPTDLNQRNIPVEVLQQAKELRSVLIAYGIAIAEVNVQRTQMGARFIRYWVRLQPPAGRLSDLQKYASDIARELGTISVPLIDNIPGEQFAGVDLPRIEPKTVLLIDALNQLPQEQPYELMVAVGQNVAGEMIMRDLSRLPHMLVAGHTGGGKSVFLASLITSLVWRHSPETLRLILVDPKLMDFPVFESLPHLHEGQVIYEPADAIGILRWLIEEESNRRALIMRDTGNRKIESYYRHHPKESLPRIVVIVDEFADIMNSLERRERQDFERQINRLAATGRARGIHLVLATQRPTVDVISGNIKANIPARVSFQLTTQTDSRTILDRSGAEALLGQGDMLFLADNQIERLQGYFASDDELEQIVQQRS